MTEQIFVGAPHSATGSTWSPWVKTSGIIVPENETANYSFDFTLTGAAFPAGARRQKSPISVEVRYFDGSDFVTATEVFGSGGGQVNVSVGGGYSTISIRVNTVGGGPLMQEIRITNDNNLEFHFADEHEVEFLDGAKPDSPGLQEGVDYNLLEPGAGDNTAEDSDSFFDAIESLILDGKSNGSPLVLDLDDDGLELVSLASGDAVWWDIDVDGFAEASGWVGADDGLLAIDMNGDGIINNSFELFGDAWGDANGFSALSWLDVNEDGAINSSDAKFNDLLVWKDANGNGYSESSELSSLSELLITEIDLGYSEVSVAIAGNEVRQASTFTIDGNAQYIGDVWFTYNDVYTVYNQQVVADGVALNLPNARGYGQVPTLQIAMSLDNSGAGNVRDLVSELADATLADIFDETTDVPDLVRDIMFRWTGVDGLTGDERGANIDSRELGFLEAMTGQPYLQRGVHPNPGPLAALDLQDAFTIAFNNVYARLVAQSAGGALFEGDFSYDISTDSFDGITGLDLTVLGNLETEATGLANTAEREVFWQNVVRVIEFAFGTDNLDGGDETALEDAIYDSDNSLDLTTILASLDFGGVIGGGTVSGDSGNNTLVGSADIDEIVGEGGDDSLEGREADDYLRGGTGTDTYIYELGDGFDTIRETTETGAHTDTILFGAGIDSGDLTFTRIGNTDLIIDIDTGSQTGRILIEGHFNDDHRDIEVIEFDDTSTINMATQNYTMHGTAGNDTLYGVVSGTYGGGEDTIYGGDGNDTIYANGPSETDTNDNTLYGEDGDDTLNGSSGEDTLYGGNGNDNLDGGADDDVLDGGAGDDEMSGGTGDDIYYFVSGNDVINGETAGTEELRLDAVWDSVTPEYLKFGNDLMIRFDADNSIYITSHYVGGSAVESMVYDDTTTVNLTTVSTVTQGDSGNNNLFGTSANDTLYGNGGNDWLTGGTSGNDNLYGGTGDDDLDGGSGNDYLDPGTGDDEADGSTGDDHFFYTAGHDSYTENSTGSGDIVELAAYYGLQDLTFSRDLSVNSNHLIITINAANSIELQGQFSASARFDTLRISGESDINLLTMDVTTHGTASGETINGISQGGGLNDTIYGYGGNDTLGGGTNGNDTLYGGDGNDTLNGNAGNDLLYGEDGDDTLDGSTGTDTLRGGADDDLLRGDNDDDLYIYDEGLDTVQELNFNDHGNDTIWITGGVTVNDISIGNTGTDEATIVVNSSVDEIEVLNLRSGDARYHVENLTFDDGFTTDQLPDYQNWLWGTSGNDMVSGNGNDNVLVGKDGADSMTGGAGDDDIHGGDGNDTIEGGDDDDVIHGGADDDTLYGEDGLDTLFGGDGADTFVFESASAFNDVDVIKDFAANDNDVIDIADVLDGYYDDGVDDITDFVEITTNGSNSELRVDTTGTGSFGGGTLIATIEGVTGLTDEAALLSSGVLVAA